MPKALPKKVVCLDNNTQHDCGGITPHRARQQERRKGMNAADKTRQVSRYGATARCGAKEDAGIKIKNLDYAQRMIHRCIFCGVTTTKKRDHEETALHRRLVAARVEEHKEAAWATAANYGCKVLSGDNYYKMYDKFEECDKPFFVEEPIIFKMRCASNMTDIKGNGFIIDYLHYYIFSAKNVDDDVSLAAHIIRDMGKKLEHCAANRYLYVELTNCTAKYDYEFVLHVTVNEFSRVNYVVNNNYHIEETEMYMPEYERI